MDILFVNADESRRKEMRDFSLTMRKNPVFANSRAEVIKCLSSGRIEQAVIHLRDITDLGILGYINRSYPKVRVIITADQVTEDTISIIRTGDYDLLSEPFHLNDLKKMI